ncbi:hypothetical protein L5515_015800 [Caenorhabditis briggsae]|uniref:Uncharacterized protein n=1 Tax=Caenorhabditis briggsae TaxID=6238 RepID=A0AAE9EI94_CAEBR|nr:hypothetical protein L5515_015800 [Caenorhabditis briggsae]
MMPLCNGAQGQPSNLVSVTLKGMGSMPSMPNLKNILGVCSRDEIAIIKNECKDVVSRPIDRKSLAYGLCCGELKVCSEFTEGQQRLIENYLQDIHTCSAFPTQVLDQKADFVDALVVIFKKEGRKFSKDDSKFFSTCTPKIKEAFNEACDKFNAKSADKETLDYNVCCKTLDNCTDPFYTQLWGEKVPSDAVEDMKSSLTECGSKQKEFLKVECDKYMATPSFKDGTKGTYGQVICCDELKFCSGPFYTQVSYGVALLLIGIIGVVVFLLCCRKKRGGGGSGGGGMKSSKKSTKKSKK